MDDQNQPKPTLPGNHGQFGENHATEAFKPLQDHPAPAPASGPDAAPASAPASTDAAPQAPKQTNAGERS